MNKTYILFYTLFISTLSACSMQGQKLHADSDDQQDNHLPSEVTDWNTVNQAVFMAGGTEREALIIRKEYNRQRAQQKSEVYSAAYSVQRGLGKSHEEASIAATEQDNKPHGSYYDPIYYQLVVGKNGEKAGRRMLSVYEKQCRQGHSMTWAQHYALAFVRDGKADQEAAKHADEMEESFTIMERFSTMAQPGDIEQQGMRAAIYRAVLRFDKPPNNAKSLVDTFEEQVQAGKSEVWAFGYAWIIAEGKSEAYARTYADACEVQAQAAGKSAEWIHAYARIIAEGESEAFARTYADTYKAQLQAGKSEDWATSYAFMIARGKSEAFARTFTDTVEEQIQAGKSEVWAHTYAMSIANGGSEAFARTYADTVEGELAGGSSQDRAFERAIFAAERAGKKNWCCF